MYRDCHYLGIPTAFDHERLLKSARVCEVNKRKHICFRDKVPDKSHFITDVCMIFFVLFWFFTKRARL